MVRVKNFHENIEKSLERLGKHVERERASYETETPPEEEIVKRSIQAFGRDVALEDGEETRREETKSGESSVLPGYLRDNDDEAVKKEVEDLVQQVFERGLEAALKSAAKHSPFVEDAFHDALVDKLLPKLKKRGIVK
jgi:hypothetical protein